MFSRFGPIRKAVASIMLFVFASSADPTRAQFVPGRIFVAEPAQERCQHSGEYRWDRIWEIDPETGDSWIFKELSDEWCGGVSGLTFTSDGSRLLVNQRFKSRIISLDEEGNAEVLYDHNDGIRGGGMNCLTFDSEDRLYMANDADIIRFPPDGGYAEIFADWLSDGLGVDSGPIAVAANGDVYFGNHLGAFNNLLSFTGVHQGAVFDSYNYNEDVITIATDSCGHVFAGMDTGEIIVYEAGDPSSRRLLFHDLSQISFFSLALSPDEQSLVIAGAGADTFEGAWSLDLRDGSLTVIAEVLGAGSIYNGIAVVSAPWIFADINRDGRLSLLDLLEFTENIEGAGEFGLMLPCRPADLNHDGAVDLRDVALFFAAFASE